jgi:hypothetical protein
MIAGQFLADVAAICATASTETSFGSGRLIAPGLILTAGHVVDFPSREAAMHTDCKVYLIGERPESGKWVPHRAELVWRGSGELDLALLRLTDAPSLTPRQRVMFASWGVVGFIDVVEAVGFPQAWSTSAIPTRDYALSGRLRISTQRGPYAWTVAPGDRPDSRDGWKGMSGGTVGKIGPDGLHILGVLEAVPANFSSGQLSVARLSFAFADNLFWNELRASLGREPRLVPWNGESTSTQTRFYSTIPTLNNRPFVGREDLLERMHKLFAKFVLDIQASEAVATPLAAIVRTQLACMVEVAQELAAHPNRADLAALLKSRATCTAGSIITASAPAWPRWVTACRAPVSSRRRCLGSSAPSRPKSRATCTAGSIEQASQLVFGLERIA